MRRVFPAGLPLPREQRLPYYGALLVGASVGAYGLGTLNLWLSGQPGIGRSIEGALFGAVVAVEAYKWLAGIRLRTGAIFALPLAVGIAVGRIGCFLAGMDDFTYGLPTDLPWGHDFGDGIPRHPVQLYESLCMFGFAIIYVVGLIRRRAWPLRMGFALVALWYGVQRFLWEFLKPYGPLVAGLSVFQVTSLLLVAYALILLRDDTNAARRTVGA